MGREVTAGWAAVAALVGAALPGAAGCGARTGLPIPDASEDASVDAPPDAPDACTPRPLELRPRRAEVMFVIDRSGSMARALDFSFPDPGEPTRWDLLRDALETSLRDADATMRLGAEMFPQPVPPVDEPPPELTCGIHRPIDMPIDSGSVDGLLRLFDDSEPRGGTPTAPAIGLGREHLLSRRTDLPQFMVLATDGAPNCNPDTGEPPDECVCSATPSDCRDSPRYGPYNCLDDERVLSELTEAREAGVPTFVVGIPDESRPDLVAVLDRMAVAGGRPRESGDDRFYSVQSPEELNEAFASIADSISRCVYSVSPRPEPDDPITVMVGGTTTPRDRSHTEGWDLTDVDRGEITLYGSACRLASTPGVMVTAELPCD